MKRYSGPSCSVCAAPLTSEYASVCAQCRTDPPPFARVINFGLYAGTLKEAIHLLKFTGLRRLAKPLGRLLQELSLPDADRIVPVPLRKATLQQRGFNQTLLLARQISKQCKIPLSMNALIKRTDTPPQIGLAAKERLSNLRDAFAVTGLLTGRHIILVDDVMTTGATVRECSRTLRKAGAEEITVVTLARSFVD